MGERHVICQKFPGFVWKRIVLAYLNMLCLVCIKIHCLFTVRQLKRDVNSFSIALWFLMQFENLIKLILTKKQNITVIT